MSKKFPPPSPPFIKARYHGGRQKPKAIVMHGTVSSDNRGTARNIARWWNGPTSPKSSCHYVVDPGETIQCVGDHIVAYHCGYNYGSIGIELCDEQQGPANRWNDADSNAILRRAARLTAELCLAYDIAVKRPSIRDLKAKGPHGIYSHNESRLAFGNTTHTDPRDFPWGKFMRLVRKEIRALRAEQQKTPSRPKNTGGFKDRMKPEEYFVGARGAHVRWLAKRLKVHGFGSHFGNGVDKFYSRGEDKKAVAAFQRAQGWTGSDADGLPGPVTLKRLRRKPAKEKQDPPRKKPRTLHLMHASMQFKDSTREKRCDAEKIFQRARRRRVAWITGTEAGPGAGKMRRELRKAAKANGYRLFIPRAATDCWIAVDKDFVAGDWKQGYRKVIKKSTAYPEKVVGKGRWGHKGIVWVSFDTVDLGRISIGAAHYLTKAHHPKSSRWPLNRRLARAIGKWAEEEGQGSNLVFYGGDQNMLDAREKQPQGDTFFGEPLTSAWDELGKYQNTGHGTIDVIASYDADGRVVAKYVRALDDDAFFLNTDHYLVEAGYEVVRLGGN